MKNIEMTNGDHLKILILTLGIEKDPWTQIECLGQNKTWKKNKHQNVQILRYIGNPDAWNTEIRVKFIWMVNTVLEKFLKLFSIESRPISMEFLSERLIPQAEIEDSARETLTVSIKDIYPLIGLKTISAFKFALEEYDFDFIFRTNVSSYVDITKLLQL